MRKPNSTAWAWIHGILAAGFFMRAANGLKGIDRSHIGAALTASGIPFLFGVACLILCLRTTRKL